MSVTATPEVFRAQVVSSDSKTGADLEHNVIRGYVVAEEGKTKTPGRGEFDLTSLEMLRDLGNAKPEGVRVRFQHPSESDDGLGKFIGRAKNFRLDQRDGRHILRADAYINDAAMTMNVNGGDPYGKYLLNLASTDPGAFQSSIVIPSMGQKLERERDADGNKQSPLFRPTKLFASDFVDEGDAVHGNAFSVDGLDALMEGSARRIPTKLAAVGAEYLDQMFPDADREVVETRINAFRDRYLSRRFGADEPPKESDMDQETKDALDQLSADQKSTDEKLSQLIDVIESDRKERQAELSANDRAAKIQALATMSGVAKDEEVAKWIQDDSFSVADVQDLLFKRKCKVSPPADDDNEAEHFATNPPSDAPDENDQYREEYAAQKRIHEQLGITEDRYIQRRRQEDGLPAETEATAA